MSVSNALDKERSTRARERPSGGSGYIHCQKLLVSSTLFYVTSSCLLLEFSNDSELSCKAASRLCLSSGNSRLRAVTC